MTTAEDDEFEEFSAPLKTDIGNSLPLTHTPYPLTPYPDPYPLPLTL